MDKEFWKTSLDQWYKKLTCGSQGLSSAEALGRLKRYGPNSLELPRRLKKLTLFISQFKSPLILLLIAAAALSFFLGDRSDASIIIGIVILSGLLGFFQERGAINALEKLLALVENKSTVLRDGKESEISFKSVVPGDVLSLRSGDIIPADCLLIEGKSFFADESTLSGESAPVEKQPGAPLFMGTTVSSGAGKALSVITGRATQYGHITEKTRFHPPKTAFEIGVQRFGYLLMIVTLILVASIFAINIVLQRPFFESFMFSLALAVGLTPQLLPAIISINLSHGARKMAKKKVVIKRLASIENFGQMNVLCADKTGTITVGKIALDRAVNADHQESEKVALYGFLSAHFQTTYANALDKALLEKLHFDVSKWKMTQEIPYDFERKRLSVIFNDLIVTKGAVPQILQVCDRVEWADGAITPIGEHKSRFESYFEEQSAKGFRAVAVAYDHKNREENLIFLGFLLFLDPLKPGIAEIVNALKQKGVQLKIITGDHHSVALHAAEAIGMTRTHLVTGEELRNVTEEGFKKIAKEKNVFAEIDPGAKEQIVHALRKAGYVVGYLGDGVNDVAALHGADVSIAVDGGADAAKETADIVLLEKDLSVLKDGIEEGRFTFTNTLKYIYMATSANFGNMFSMAGASLFLSFLPLLPKQVLLVNLLTDIPEMAIATDRVDPEALHRPLKWDLRKIARFMLVFGLISSLFDYATFGVLLFLLKANEMLFQTGWFIESVVSATLVVFAIRTRRFLLRSKPGRLLAFSILTIVLFVVVFIPFFAFLGFVPLPWIFYATLAPLVFLYIAAVELAKHFFFHNNKHKGAV